MVASVDIVSMKNVLKMLKVFIFFYLCDHR